MDGIDWRDATADWFRCEKCGEVPDGFACGCTRAALDQLEADRDHWRALVEELVEERPNPTTGVVLLVPKGLVDRARAALAESGGGP